MSETIKPADVRVKRAYDPARPEDGRRVLVDRLWPRGVSKAEAHIDEWLKHLAPSTELRKWFGHVRRVLLGESSSDTEGG